MEENFNKKVQINKEKIKEMVPNWFSRWMKVFEKVELKRMPVRKPQDHAMNLKKDFILRKKRIYTIQRRKGRSQRICGEAVKESILNP